MRLREMEEEKREVKDVRRERGWIEGGKEGERKERQDIERKGRGERRMRGKRK